MPPSFTALCMAAAMSSSPDMAQGTLEFVISLTKGLINEQDWSIYVSDMFSPSLGSAIHDTSFVLSPALSQGHIQDVTSTHGYAYRRKNQLGSLCKKAAKY